LRVGDAEIVLLEDRWSLPRPLAQVYPNVPADAWRPFVERYPATYDGAGNSRSPVRCYVVRSQGRTILVDTGVGPADGPIAGMFGGGGALIDLLAAEGIAPAQVDTVFFTHLHPDHVGWNLVGGRPCFPDARYLVPQAEWDALPAREQRSPVPYIDAAIKPLAALGVLELRDGEHALTSELTAIPTPGHAAGHTSLLVSSGGQRALINGDAFGGPAQVTNPDWASIYDEDGALASRTRRGLLDRIESEDLVLVATHFPAPGHGRIVRDGGQLFWQPG
jgi:glyoxylase-like metal-dependent hydrolase (beta-lactamase superfamily II)